MDEMKLAELIRSAIREEIKGLQNEMNGRFDKIEDVQREMHQMLKTTERKPESGPRN